jgi:diguanylate cyclase (GGDEF)-like protein
MEMNLEVRMVVIFSAIMPLILGVLMIIYWHSRKTVRKNARLEFDLQEAQQNLLSMAEADRHKLIQLGLLDETSRSLAESLDEVEIMQRTVNAVVKRFGYAEAAFSLLVEGDCLEIAAIDGTEDIGYRPGFRQKMGEGIIGHTAAERQVYISGEIENDPYYFSIGKRSGSAVCVPMLNEDQLLGVLYVESTTRHAFTQDDIRTLVTLVSHAVTAIQKARLYARAQAQLRAISALQSVSQTILSSLELKQIFQSVVQLLKDTFNYTYVSIYTVHDQVLRLGGQAGYPEELVIYEIPVTAGITGRCVQTKQVQFIRDVSADPTFLRASYDIESEICAPILNAGHILGVINVEAAPGHPLTDDDVALLTALSAPVAIAIENAHLHAEVKKLALTDGLTNLFNRRAFDDMLANELDRAARYNYPLALIIIDMDSFKQFNDRWGHPAGDERLKEVAALLRSGLRSPDFVARYGGEEFGLILPFTSKTTAGVLAERLRAAAETSAPDQPAHQAEIPGYTFSMGIATFPEDGRTAAELLRSADHAELTAKKLGKNRVYICQEE